MGQSGNRGDGQTTSLHIDRDRRQTFSHHLSARLFDELGIKVLVFPALNLVALPQPKIQAHHNTACRLKHLYS